MNHLRFFENFLQAEPIMYTTLQKRWREEKEKESFETWQRSVLEDYADLVIDLANRRLFDKQYLSLEEREDFVHCYDTLLKYRFRIPKPEKDWVEKVYNDLQ